MSDRLIGQTVKIISSSAEVGPIESIWIGQVGLIVDFFHMSQSNDNGDLVVGILNESGGMFHLVILDPELHALIHQGESKLSYHFNAVLRLMA